MDASLALQYLVIAIAVIASIGFIANNKFPNATRKLRVALAVPLVREGRPSWLRAIGRKIAPPPKASGTCGSCDKCG